MVSKLFSGFIPSLKNFEHVLPIYVCLLFIRYIHVLLKFLLHPNELSCMHSTLETTVLENQPKNKKKKQPKTTKTERSRQTFVPTSSLAGRERKAEEWQAPGRAPVPVSAVSLLHQMLGCRLISDIKNCFFGLLPCLPDLAAKFPYSVHTCSSQGPVCLIPTKHAMAAGKGCLPAVNSMALNGVQCFWDNRVVERRGH